MFGVNEALDNSIKFLSSSSCIDMSDDISNGGFFGFQNTLQPLRDTDMPFIFYEITGYGINLLLKLSRWYNDEKFLQLAKNAASCILKAQVESKNPKSNGAIYDRYYTHSRKFFESFHAYPNAVCAGALCELYQSTKEEKLRESAIKIKDWLFEISINDLCVGFNEFYEPGQISQKVFPYESICIPFILLKFQKELELSEKEKNRLIESVNWGKKTQTNDGFFPFFYSLESKRFNTTAYSHFTIYPLYNLMGFPLAELDELGCSECFQSYQKCGEWMTRIQDANGGFFTYYFKGDHVWHQQSPAVGQALCAFLLLYEKTGDKKFLESARRSSQWLVENQIKEGKFSGGYYWIHPNKKYSNIQKKIMYAKERLTNKISDTSYTTDVTVLLDKVPIWPVQFAIEGLYRYSKLDSS